MKMGAFCLLLLVIFNRIRRGALESPVRYNPAYLPEPMRMRTACRDNPSEPPYGGPPPLTQGRLWRGVIREER